jgi:hypothetical protein
MTFSLMLFITLALLLVLVLAWAARPPKNVPLTPDEVFAALSEERHYARLPQILQSLREEDTDFMRDRGHGQLLLRLRQERKRIALGYLNYLEEEFRILLECSRILATLSPELAFEGEFQRLRQNFWFLWNCRYLGWKLRVGLPPWDSFGTLSDMAGTMTLRLEAATARLAERALLVTDAGLIPDQGRGGSK